MTDLRQTLIDEKARAELAKLEAETSRINSRSRWIPFMMGAGMTLALIVIVKLFD